MKRIICVATVLGTLALFPVSASASGRNFLGGGGVSGGATSADFGTGITSDTSGMNVHGQFTVASREGTVTVRATCLEVGPGIGALDAGAGGEIIAATGAFASNVGQGFTVLASDSTVSGEPDTIGNITVPAIAPGPNECPPGSAVPIARGTAGTSCCGSGRAYSGW